MKTLDKLSTNGKGQIKRNRTALPSKKLITKKDYDNAMNRIDSLMEKGSEKVSKSELEEIRRLALLAQAYEKSIYVIPMPTTLAGIIEMKMHEMGMKQNELAQRVHISDAKLSLILNGKQRPDVSFLKSVWHELGIDGNLLMKVV